MIERWSAYTSWAFTAIALVIGVPLFLCMPPWCDLTLYDEAAANLLSGGVHYRDVFDTNLPGFVWLLTAIRALFGPSLEAVWVVDLLIVFGIITLGERAAAYGGASASARGWAVAGATWFYLFTSEFNHAQRDIWMLAPVLVAIWLRMRNFTRSHSKRFRLSLLEGILWGCAVWIKPHVVIPGLLVWLVSTLPHFRKFGVRSLFLDTLGLLTGGGIMGAVGLYALHRSGTWDAFVDVFTFWNQGYAKIMWIEFPQRIENHFRYFAPWTYAQVVAVPVAVVSILDGLTRNGMISKKLPWRCWTPAATPEIRYARLLFSTLYLGWTAQALIVQRGFHYVHVPEILMLFFVVATQCWHLGMVMIVWCLTTSLIVIAGYHHDETLPAGRVFTSDPDIWCVQHPITKVNRLKEWPNCFTWNSSESEIYARRQRLAMIQDFFPANDWNELYEVAVELRRLGAKDEDVVAWHDAPHAVYRMIPVRPGFRFMHVRAMMGMSVEHEDRVWAELIVALPKAKYVVSDLLRVGYEDPTEIGDRSDFGPDMLPPSLSADVRATFPFDRPVIFRTKNGTGRYLIHLAYID